MKAAKPRKVLKSDSLDRLLKLKRNFAVRPAGFDKDRWADRRISTRQASGDKKDRKRLIKEADQSIKGVDFPAKEMAQIIKGWMAEED